jgi:hypothetical protein
MSSSSPADGPSPGPIRLPSPTRKDAFQRMSYLVIKLLDSPNGEINNSGKLLGILVFFLMWPFRQINVRMSNIWCFDWFTFWGWSLLESRSQVFFGAGFRPNILLSIRTFSLSPLVSQSWRLQFRMALRTKLWRRNFRPCDPRIDRLCRAIDIYISGFIDIFYIHTIYIFIIF